MNVSRQAHLQTSRLTSEIRKEQASAEVQSVNTTTYEQENLRIRMEELLKSSAFKQQFLQVSKGNVFVRELTLN